MENTLEAANEIQEAKRLKNMEKIEKWDDFRERKQKIINVYIKRKRL